MAEINRYTPGKLDPGKTVGSIRYPDLITTFDFTDVDPWFRLLADYNEAHPKQFTGRTYLELGIGGGLQAVAALTGLEKRLDLPPITKITGIDIDAWRLNIAAQNLDRFSRTPYTLYQGDAVRWIEEQQEKIIDTAAIMCLPQAPLPKSATLRDGHDSTADTYHEELLPKFAQKYNRWGLGLNAAVLGALIKHVGNNTDVSAVFSGRVPENVIRDMVYELGWKIVNVVQTAEPIQQDPDTDISYVGKYAEESYEDLFYEKLPGGKFGPIQADEAERRLRLADKSRDNFNVYHHVAVWHLEPK
ncbi:hypothetical protein HZC27_01830 [Candidatus Roizmanbacteria bacterium]|nr:hypothetical protein [Candidatus Roizmanbacteria bacterium]